MGFNYFSKLRLKLRYFSNKNISIDPSCRIFKKSNIDIIASGKIRIGKRCYIHDYAQILTYGGDITIGDNCSVNPYTILYGHGGLTIGNGVRIAAHCVIIPSNHNFNDPTIPIFQQGHTMKGIRIEDDVWIGANSTILDGVTIGKGAVIGAGSVVTRSINEYSIAVGNPAKTIRKRGEQRGK